MSRFHIATYVLSLFTIICFIAAVPFIGSAQEASSDERPTASSTNSNVPKNSQAQELFPSLRVGNVTTEKDTYEAGETVNGSFVLANISDEPVPSAYYQLSLGDRYENERMPPERIYESVREGPFYLRANQQRSIDFSYTLPESASSSDVAIEVQSELSSGLLKGRARAPITVTGGDGFVRIPEVRMTSGGDQDTAQGGITVDRGGFLKINFDTYDRRIGDLELTPHVKIYDFVRGDDEVASFTGDTFPFQRDRSDAHDLRLPTDLEDGVYAGVLVLKDEEGRVRSPEVEFKYIVGNDIARVHHVTSPNQSIDEGQTLPLKVVYTGQPLATEYDSYREYLQAVRNDEIERRPMQMAIEVTDAAGTVVASEEREVESPIAATSAAFQLTADRSASDLTATVSLSNDNGTLHSFTANLTGDGAGSRDGGMIPTVVGAVIMLIAIAILGSMWGGTTRSAKMPVLILGLMVAGAGVAAVATPTSTEAQYMQMFEWEMPSGAGLIPIEVDMGASGWWDGSDEMPTYGPEETYWLDGSVSVPSSVTEGLDFMHRWEAFACPPFEGCTTLPQWEDPEDGWHYYGSHSHWFSLGQFETPPHPGYYEISVKFEHQGISAPRPELYTFDYDGYAGACGYEPYWEENEEREIDGLYNDKKTDISASGYDHWEYSYTCQSDDHEDCVSFTNHDTEEGTTDRTEEETREYVQDDDLEDYYYDGDDWHCEYTQEFSGSGESYTSDWDWCYGDDSYEDCEDSYTVTWGWDEESGYPVNESPDDKSYEYDTHCGGNRYTDLYDLHGNCEVSVSETEWEESGDASDSGGCGDDGTYCADGEDHSWEYDNSYTETRSLSNKVGASDVNDRLDTEINQDYQRELDEAQEDEQEYDSCNSNEPSELCPKYTHTPSDDHSYRDPIKFYGWGDGGNESASFRAQRVEYAVRVTDMVPKAEATAIVPIYKCDNEAIEEHNESIRDNPNYWENSWYCDFHNNLDDPNNQAELHEEQSVSVTANNEGEGIEVGFELPHEEGMEYELMSPYMENQTRTEPDGTGHEMGKFAIRVEDDGGCEIGDRITVECDQSSDGTAYCGEKDKVCEDTDGDGNGDEYVDDGDCEAKSPLPQACDECPDGQIEGDDGECCPPGDVIDGTCGCPDGEYQYDGGCHPCPDGESEGSDGSCCPDSEMINGSCGCPDGQQLVDGSCDPCPEGSTDCCPDGEQADGEGGCDPCPGGDCCPDGQESINGSCDPCPAGDASCCPDGQQADGSGSCDPCPEGSTDCCPEGQESDGSGGCDPCPEGESCDCPDGQEADGSGGCDDCPAGDPSCCPEGQESDGFGNCTDCPEGESCDCPDGQQADGDGNCTDCPEGETCGCPDGQVSDGNGGCGCPDGEQYVDGSCEPCPGGDCGDGTGNISCVPEKNDGEHLAELDETYKYLTNRAMTWRIEDEEGVLNNATNISYDWNVRSENAAIVDSGGDEVDVRYSSTGNVEFHPELTVTYDKGGSTNSKSAVCSQVDDQYENLGDENNIMIVTDPRYREE